MTALWIESDWKIFCHFECDCSQDNDNVDKKPLSLSEAADGYPMQWALALWCCFRCLVSLSRYCSAYFRVSVWMS